MEKLHNTILHGNCIEEMGKLPEKSVDLIFADPPYNLQLKQELKRPNLTTVDAVDDDWDKFEGFSDYQKFTHLWLSECRRILKDTGTIWVIGSYHNIFQVGKIMHDLGYWTLNDVHWYKTNPMPNFRGTRYQNATETMIWAKKSEKQKKYTFNYQTMKTINDDKQMKNVWEIPLCRGEERIMIDGKKAHSTQKPEQLLFRVIISSSNKGDLVFDPFMGSGTTAAAAKKLGRNYLGIEQEKKYIDIINKRLNSIDTVNEDIDEKLFITPSKRDRPKVSFATLIESGYLNIGDKLSSKNEKYKAEIAVDGNIVSNEIRGSIHKVGAKVQNIEACNGWDFWFKQDGDQLINIDHFREKYLEDHELI